jgi:CHAT domain-containing protein/tetratricopeptide (TPR) repeat protein
MNCNLFKRITLFFFLIGANLLIAQKSLTDSILAQKHYQTALDLYKCADFDGAIKSAALSADYALLAGDSLQYYVALKKQGDAWFELDDYPKTDSIIKIIQKTDYLEKNGNPTIVSEYLRKKAFMPVFFRKAALTDSLLEVITPYILQNCGKGSREYLRLLGNKSSVAIILKQNDKAQEILKKQLELLESERPNDTLMRIDVYRNLSNRGYQNNKLYWVEKTAQLLQNNIDLDPYYAYRTYNDLKLYYNSNGRYDLGKEVILITYEIVKEKLCPAYLKYSEPYLLNGLGIVSRRLGEPEKAIAYYEEGISKTPNLMSYKQMLGSLYNNLGNAYKDIGELKRAAHYQRNALQIEQDIVPNVKNPILAMKMLNLGFVYSADANYIDAKEMAEKALETRKKEYKEDQKVEINYYSLLAGISEKLGDTLATLQYLKEMETYFDSTNECQILKEMDYYNIHIDLARRMKNNLLALSYAQKEVKCDLTDGNIDHLIQSFLNLAECYELVNEYDAALKNLENGELKMADLLSNNDNAKKWESLIKALKISIYSKKYENNADKSALSKGLDLVPKLEQLFYELLKSNRLDQNLNYKIGHLISFYLVLDRVYPHQYYAEKAYKWLELRKNLELKRLFQEAKAKKIANVPAGILIKEKEIKQRLAYLSQQSYEKSGTTMGTDTSVAKIEKEIIELEKQDQAIQKRIETEFPAYKSLANVGSDETPEKIRALLAPKQCYLDYAVLDQKTIGFLVTADTFLYIALEDESKWTPLVETMKKGLTDWYLGNDKTSKHRALMQKKYTQSAHQLYEILIKPFVPWLTDRVLVSPEYGNFNLPFDLLLENEPDSLVSPKNWQYLVKKYAISYTPSASLLREMKIKATVNDTKIQYPIVTFAPYFEGDTLKLANQFPEYMNIRKDLNPLPSSGEEAFKVAKLMRGKSFIGKDASKENFLKVAEKAKILHFATHGKANVEYPDFSYLAFYDTEKKPQAGPLLYVGEVYNLNLQADLVMLSACETGLGREKQYEGTFSFVRAFSFAGAKMVVATLWSVNDENTKEVVLKFYRQLKIGLPVDVALQQAKLLYLASDKTKTPSAHPYFWGGFMATGSSK